MYPCWKFRSDPWSFFFLKALPDVFPFEILSSVAGTVHSSTDWIVVWECSHLVHMAAVVDCFTLSLSTIWLDCVEHHSNRNAIVVAFQSSLEQSSLPRDSSKKSTERLEELKQQKKWWFLYLIRTEEDAQIVFEIIFLPPPSLLPQMLPLLLLL